MARSLRYSMTVVLGVGAVNEEKFTTWAPKQKVLGLEFDSVVDRVSMFAAKITKARGLVAAAFHTVEISLKGYRLLLGSLRHVATCIRSARPFLQRLRQLETNLHKFKRVTISEDMRRDLLWLWQILHSPLLNGVSLEYFNALPPADVIVEMDACDHGLCALDVSDRVALTYAFLPSESQLIARFKDGERNGFDINFRELLSCAFAAHAWGDKWHRRSTSGGRPLHVHFLIDNTSAVAWGKTASMREIHEHRTLSDFSGTGRARYASASLPPILRAPTTPAQIYPLLPTSKDSRYSGAIFPRAFRCRLHVRQVLFGDDQVDRLDLAPRHTSLASWIHIDGKVQVISDFILHGFQFGFGSGARIRGSTITLTLLGILHFFAAAGVEFPNAHPHVRMLLKGTRRLDVPSRHKAPVSLEMLELSFDSLRFVDPFDRALWGVVCLAFFFLMRRSEIVAINGSSFKWFVLRTEDLVVLVSAGEPTLYATEAWSVHLRLRGSKTNQEGNPTARMLFRSGHRFLCPVFSALLLLRAQKDLPVNIPAAVYMGAAGLPACVTTAHVSRAIKRAASQTGEDPKKFSSHSLRAGGATHMYRAGVDALTIQFHGRWISDSFKIHQSLHRIRCNLRNQASHREQGRFDTSLAGTPMTILGAPLSSSLYISRWSLRNKGNCVSHTK